MHTPHDMKLHKDKNLKHNFVYITSYQLMAISCIIICYSIRTKLVHIILTFTDKYCIDTI